MLEKQVDVVLAVRFQNSLKFDDVVMLHIGKYLNFPISSLGINSVHKSIKYFFERIYFLIGLRFNLPDKAIRATAYFLNNLIFL